MNSLAVIHQMRQHYWNLFLLVGLLSLSLSEAFLNKRQVGWKQPQHQQQAIISAHQVTKSGGKLIETEEMYAEAVLGKDSPRPVLVFFSAPWCGPCRLTNPVVKEIMKQFTGEIDVLEVCTDDLAEVAEQAGVISIPTIQFYYDGKVLDTIVGCVAKGVLANAVEKVLEDMQQVKQQRP